MILRACEELNQCGHPSQRVLTGCRRMPWRHQARIDRPTGARLWHPGVRCPPGSAQHVSRGAADERTLAYRAQNRQHPGPAHHDGRWCSALSPRAATARGRPGLWATLRDLSEDPARSIPIGSEHPGGPTALRVPIWFAPSEACSAWLSRGSLPCPSAARRTGRQRAAPLWPTRHSPSLGCAVPVKLAPDSGPHVARAALVRHQGSVTSSVCPFTSTV